MKPIQFETVLGADGVIHPPTGVALPEGAIEVTVRSLPVSTAVDSQQSVAVHSWLLEYASEAERLSPDLPSDMAEHHDHYAHGTPLP